MTSADMANPEFEVVVRMPDMEAYRLWSTGFPLYLPWEDRNAPICEASEDVVTLSVNEPARLYYLAALARHAKGLGGAFCECGVFRGGTALLLARVTSDTGSPLHLVDSFEGLSAPSIDRDVFYIRGDFCFDDEDCIRGLLAEAGERVHVHRGWIPEILETLPISRWSFVHVDLDLYDPTLAACEYFYDHLLVGGVMMFDEYGFPTCRGERDAVDQFFLGKTESPIILPTGQAFILKV